MSPYLHHQLACARQQEFAGRAANLQRVDDAQSDANGHRNVKRRVGRLVAVLGVCLTAGTAVAVGSAPPNHHGGHLSAQQLEREIKGWEAKGYVPVACTVNGTLLRNYRTGQSVTVKL
jgi:hypothetical protein